jgi:type II secretory pathway component GspD/PulD (secretin)
MPARRRGSAAWRARCSASAGNADRYAGRRFHRELSGARRRHGDTITNSVSITDIPQAVPELEAYTRNLDVRQPQVHIKAKIILVDRTQLEGLGCATTSVRASNSSARSFRGLTPPCQVADRSDPPWR